jgi:hypothetical protein
MRISTFTGVVGVEAGNLAQYELASSPSTKNITLGLSSFAKVGQTFLSGRA